jgi:hypothetical protein
VKRLWWLSAMLVASTAAATLGSCSDESTEAVGGAGGGAEGGSGGTAGAGGLGGTGAGLPNFGPLRKLASGQAHPTRLVLDSQSVYWINQGPEGGDGTVMKVAKTGGTATTLATASGEQVTALALDGISLYWAHSDGTSGTIAVMSASGGVSQTLVTDASWAGDLAIGADTIYWSRIGLGSGISSAIKSGGSPSSILDGASLVTFLRLEGNTLYFVDTGAGPQNGQIGALVLGEHTPTTLADALARPRHLGADADTLYFATEGDGHVRSVPKATSGAETLAYGQQGPYGLALDETSLYWTNRAADPATDACMSGDGSVMAMSLEERIPVVLAEGLHCPMAIAVDDSGVYWVEYGSDSPVGSGAVKGLPKR